MCPCKEVGWCEAYQRRMSRKEIELCQENTQRGAKYRKFWASKVAPATQQIDKIKQRIAQRPTQTNKKGCGCKQR